MKFMAKAATALFLSLATAGMSSTVMAYEEGRTNYTPEAAIQNVISLAHEAAGMIENGSGTNQEIADKIKASSDMTKEINANDQVDIARARANKHLKAARSEALKGNLQPAEQHLRKGIEDFEKLKSLL